LTEAKAKFDFNGRNGRDFSTKTNNNNKIDKKIVSKKLYEGEYSRRKSGGMTDI
jgi:hypothetical protein